MADTKFHIVETKEPAYAVTIRNPGGDLLTVRAPLVVSQTADGAFDAAQTIKDTLDLFKGMASEIVGAVWTDSPEVYFASFDPAVAQAMAEGATLEDALDTKDPDKRQVAAYERLKSASKSGGGGRGGGGGGSKGSASDILALEDMPAEDYNALPEGFISELHNGTRCPDCRNKDAKFWDNRNSDRGGPKFACANKNCEGGGKKQNGGYFPWGWFGSKDGGGGSSGGGGRGGDSGGGRRRSRGD